MSTDYLYHDWDKVLFNESIEDKNVDWKNKYPQWIKKKLQQKDYDDHLNEKIKIISVDAPYNQDNDHTKMHQQVNDTHERQEKFHLKFKDLDPMQQHFLHKADHLKLKSFIDGLNRKQHIFLRWLIFCYYNKVKCNGMKYLPKTFNKSKHFGYDFVWYEINGWPQLIEHNDKSEALQLEIGRHHSQFTKFIDAEPNEIIFIPNEQQLKVTLSEFEQVLKFKNSNPIFVGIELSPGHVDKKYRYIIECQLFKMIEETMFSKKDKPCFVRLKKIDNDYIVPYLPCRLI